MTAPCAYILLMARIFANAAFAMRARPIGTLLQRSRSVHSHLDGSRIPVVANRCQLYQLPIAP
jgi:hypothetical protein